MGQQNTYNTHSADMVEAPVHLAAAAGRVNFQPTSVEKFTPQWRSQGFQSGGLRGRVREGVHPLPLGVRGTAPGKIFKLQMHVGEF
jgi:hypothetical protein